eukprot:15067177-Ditylum_brightwellii.AAC.2
MILLNPGSFDTDLRGRNTRKLRMIDRFGARGIIPTILWMNPDSVTLTRGHSQYFLCYVDTAVERYSIK